MIDTTGYKHHPFITELSDLICKKTQNNDKGFFIPELAYFAGKIASNMRVDINTKDRGKIPVNIYAILLSISGAGKGHSVGIIENEILKEYKHIFLDETFPKVEERELAKLAQERFLSPSNVDAQGNTKVLEEDMKSRVERDYASYGAYPFTFDSGTTPAVKQLRQKLLMSKIGSISFQVDECYTDDMEILTDRGFILFKNLKKTDLVAQYNSLNGDLTWVKPLRYIERDYKGTIYNFKSRDMDFSVTPNHLVAYVSSKNGITKKAADSLPRSVKFISRPNPSTKGICDHLSDYEKLNILTTLVGNITPSGAWTYKTKNRQKLIEFERLATLTGKGYSREEEYLTCIRFTPEEMASLGFFKTLYDVIPYISDMSSNYAEELANYICFWVNRGIQKDTVFVAEKDLADLIQELFIIAGYKTYLHYCNERTAYRVTYRKTDLNTTIFRKEVHMTAAQYDGTVYCVEVPSGLIVVRRNGKTCIQGNCGSNLLGSTELLNIYLELYDQGMTKLKLVKNTADNVRAEEIDGKTPANMLLFGTPAKVFDGGKTEDCFYEFLEIGFARRCIFGIGHVDKKAYQAKTPEQIYRDLIDPQNDAVISRWRTKLAKLADESKYNWQLDLPDDVAIELLAYKIQCERIADSLPDFEEIQKAELMHRYFKALKLAGAYAFIDESLEITMENLHQAILLVEESGEAFRSIMHREKNYMKLAKYIATAGSEVTHADLSENLPFYKNGVSARNELMTMAMAWGYKNNISIKQYVRDSIDFFKGEILESTDLNKCILSYSTDMAYNYVDAEAPFNQLTKLFCLGGYHWANHKFKDNHRREENALRGFNLIVIDVDEGKHLKLAQECFKDYKYIIYKTKSHCEDNHRFRIVFPTNYVLKMNSEEYKEFMNGIFKWLPFSTDESSNQRSKKWESCSKFEPIVHDEGRCFDVLPFIPKTSRNEQYQKSFAKVQSFSNLERWFATRISAGNRNNQLFKYACALMDTGLSYPDVECQLKEFNRKLIDHLSDEELDSTILKSIASKYSTKEG